MAFVRDALNALPSKPGFVLALLVAVGGTAWYYIPTYRQCTALQEGRQRFADALAVAARSPDKLLRLDRAIPGDWDEVRIRQALVPGQPPLDCPFGWDIDSDRRQALIDAGEYTVIGLFRGDAFRHYIEWPADQGRFVDPPPSLARDKATFRVDPAASPPTLTLAPVVP